MEHFAEMPHEPETNVSPLSHALPPLEKLDQWISKLEADETLPNDIRIEKIRHLREMKFLLGSIH